MEWWIALTAADCGLLLGASDQSVYKRRKSSSAAEHCRPSRRCGRLREVCAIPGPVSEARRLTRATLKNHKKSPRPFLAAGSASGHEQHWCSMTASWRWGTGSLDFRLLRPIVRPVSRF
jgi:hypothetical protein